MKFVVKYTGRLGPAKDDEKQIRILNSTATWREGVEHEGDQRHEKIAMKEYGLDRDSSVLILPGAKDNRMHLVGKLVQCEDTDEVWR